MLLHCLVCVQVPDMSTQLLVLTTAGGPERRRVHGKHRALAAVTLNQPPGTRHDDQAATAQATLPLGPPGCSTAHQQKQFCARACYCSQEGGRRDALNGPLIYLFKQQSS